MGNVFDSMATQPQQSQPVAPTPTPTGAPQASPATGNAFDQMAAQTPPATKVASSTIRQQDDHQSDTADWLHKIWGTVSDKAENLAGRAVEASGTGSTLSAINEYGIKPYQQSMEWAGKKAGELAEGAATLNENAEQLFQDLIKHPTKLRTPLTVKQAEEKFPVELGLTGAIGEVAGGTLADPRNWPLMAGKFARPILNRVMSGAFAGQMGKGVKDQAEQLAENWDNMSPYDRWKSAGQLGLGTAMTAAATAHAASGEVKAPTPVSDRGTVAGERTTVRPTTQMTAGVEAPITARQQENPNLFTKMASELAKPGEATKFQKELTKPAAQRQVISTLSQVATDKIAAHDALVNGEQTPESITGTQTPGQHLTPDEMWPEMQKSAGATWQKARDASARDMDIWNQERSNAEQTHRSALDRYNSLVDTHNADPANAGDNELSPQTFNPDDVDHREKPQTFDELKASLDAAKDRTGYNNPTDVRQKARDVEVPKAEKAMDQWFQDHSDQVTPAEYQSAKSLWADSERFKEISNNLRGKLAKGTLTGNDIRGLEAVVNGKAIARRGAAGLGEFQRLVGPEAMDNLQTVSKLFDPLESTNPLANTVKSWGQFAVKQILAGVLGKEFGVSAWAGAEGASYAFTKFMHNVLFNPEFGQSFSKFVDATKNALANGSKVPGEIISNFKDKLSNVIEKYKNSRLGGEEGAVGANVKRRNVGPGAEKTATTPLAGEGPDVQDLYNQALAAGPTWTPEKAAPVIKALGDNFELRGSVGEGRSTGNDLDIWQKKGNLSEAESTLKRLGFKYNGQTEHGETWTKGDQNLDLWDSAHEPKKGFGKDTDIELNADERNPVAAAADEYNKSQGRLALNVEQLEPDARREKIADALDKMEHNPNDPKVKEAYKALIDESKAQKKFLESKGYTFDKTSEDPYKSYEEMRDDVKNNKHLSVWTGGNPLAEDHPLGKIDKESGWRNNDIMRGVHDVMGHVAGDNDFGEKGEENAYNLHRQAFSEKALPALTTETKGQTSWFFNNKDVRAGKALGEFPEQKAGVLPEHLYSVDVNKNIASLTNENGGATYNPTQGDMGGTDAYAVPMFKELSRTVDGDKVTPEQIKKYMNDPEVKAKLEADPRLSIGTWANGGKVYLDLSAAIPDREEAIRLGKENGQKAITYLKNFEDIPLGGTGTGTPLDAKDLAASEITTRRPTAVGADLSNKTGQHSNMAAVDEAGQNSPSRKTALGKQTMGYKEKLARTVAQYPGLDFTPEELANPDKVLGKFVNHVAGNLEWLYNQVPEEIRGLTRQWYDAAHTMIESKAARNGYSLEQGAGVTAALSPQNPWDNNVALADRVMDVYKNRQNFPYSPEMEKSAADLKKVPTQTKAFKGLLKDIAGKKLGEVKNADPDVQAVQRALWVRLYDEAHGFPVNDQYSPTGEVVGHSPSQRSWIGLDHVSKAVKILDNGSVSNINDVMGNGHKIRNFYNNIVNPNSKAGHTTIDTHAVAAGLLSPLGPKDLEAAHNFSGSVKGVPGPPKDSATGLRGTYPLYAEAYQRVARKLGILPRELQSVSWEAIKALMGDEKKTPELKARVKEIWQDVQEGKLTADEARDSIKSVANGFSKPAWMSDEQWEKLGAEGEDTSFNPDGGE